jgi:metal-dependent amidase/aminoacylase/carboxypeptidase family protein
MRSYKVSPLAPESRDEPAYLPDCIKCDDGILTSVGQELQRFGWNIVACQRHVGIVASIGHESVRKAVGLCVMSADVDAPQPQTLVRSFLGVAEALSRNPAMPRRVNLCLLLPDTYAGEAPSMDIVEFLQSSRVSAMYYLCLTSLLPARHFATGPAVTMANGIPFRIKIAHPTLKTRRITCCPETVVVGSQIVLALKTLVSETLHPFALPAKLSCTHFRNATALDIDFEGIEIKGRLRTTSNDIQTTLQIRMREVGAAICNLHGMRFFLDFPNPRHGPDRQMNRALAVASMLVGDERIDLASQPIHIPDSVADAMVLTASSFMFMGQEQGCREVLIDADAAENSASGNDELSVRYLVAIVMSEVAESCVAKGGPTEAATIAKTDRRNANP